MPWNAGLGPWSGVRVARGDSDFWLSCSELGRDEREVDTVSVALGERGERWSDRCDWGEAKWSAPARRSDVKRPRRPPWTTDDGRVARPTDCLGQCVTSDCVIVLDRV